MVEGATGKIPVIPCYCTLTIASAHEWQRGVNNCDDLGEGAAECLGRYWYAYFKLSPPHMRTGIANGSRGYVPDCSDQAYVFMGIDEGLGLILLLVRMLSQKRL